MKNKLTKVLLTICLAIGLSAVATAAQAADSWPGDSGSVIADGGSLGAGYEPSGIVYHSERNQLVIVGDDGDVTTMNTDGSNIDTDSPGGDLEGVAIADATSNFVYVGVENPDTIKQFDLSTGNYTGKQWTLTAWMASTDPNRGLEALTFVPNGFHPYANSSSGGLFYAGLQENGKIYVFNVNTGTSESVSHVDTITPNPGTTDISGLDFNSETELVYAIFDGANELLEMQTNKTVVNTYDLPGNAQEGISVKTNCPSTSARVYIAEDDPPKVKSFGSFPIVCQDDDGGDNSDNGDNGNGSGGTTSSSSDKNTIVTTPGYGGTSQVRTFNSLGQATYTPGFFAYAQTLRVGFNVAAGDLNGDGQDEIITAPRKEGAPQIRVFDMLGNPVFTPGFYAYDPNLRCGVDVAVGDLDGNGHGEIITVPGEGCSSQVKIFNFVGEPLFTLGFFAYDQTLTSGFRVAAGDVNGDGRDEIITSPAQGVPAHVRIFNYVGEPRFTPGFYAYASTLPTGADVACVDLNDDNNAEIITVPGNGFPAHVRSFNFVGEPVVGSGFFAYATGVRTGFNVSGGDLNDDGQGEIVVSPRHGAPAHIRTFNSQGQVTLNAGFFSYNQAWPLGADVAAGNF